MGFENEVEQSYGRPYRQGNGRSKRTHGAVLKAQINKTDRNDARGIAQMMRAGLYRPVHVKDRSMTAKSSKRY